MTTLCFYQGLRTIGGTIVEVRTEKARCLFDFGFVYSPAKDHKIVPRLDAILKDGLRLGALPPIEGLYNRTDLCSLPLPAYGESLPLPFVLISHMHIDHMGALGLLADEAEVYMTEDSRKLYCGLVKTNDVFYRPHCQTFGVPPMEWRQKGDLSFRMIPVDHDVPGACGLEIVTPDGRICYTGDLRLHGFHPERTLAFADMARGADVCITEGVTASFIEDFDAVVPDKGLHAVMTEEALQSAIAAAASDAAGLVFINLYPRNIERVRLLRQTLADAGRTLVLEPDAARLYRQFYPEDTLDVYAPLADGYRLYNAGYVTRDAMRAEPKRYVLQLSYAHLLETLDYAPAESLYIHADGAPLGAYDPSFQRLHDFLERQGIAYRSIRSGGHAEPAQLKYLLTEIAPKTLVPLHSLTPEKVRIPGIKQCLPEAGRQYRLSGGTLIPIEE